MITGFNTDVEYKGVTYHVQTEDKGLDTPLILSLVYNRGTILASKRSPYNDLLLGQFSEKELAERLQRQHKLICAAIRAGRIDDLKRMNSKKSAQMPPVTTPLPTKKQGFRIEKEIIIQPQAETTLPIKNTPLKPFENKIIISETYQPPTQVEETLPQPILQPEYKFPEPIQKPNIELSKPEPEIENVEEIIDAPIEITDADLIFDVIENIDDTQDLSEPILLSEEAVEIVTDFFATDQAVDDNQLLVQLMNEVVFKSGESKTISVLASRGKAHNALVGASVLVKVLGSGFRPLIFHSKTDSNGVAIINLQLPQFSRGRAAVLIKAMSGGDEAEIRRVIQPN